MKKEIRMLVIISLYILVSYNFINAQNRGNNIFFQGVENIAESNASVLGLGGAYTSIYGTVNVLSYNTACLAGINNIQVSISGGSVTRKWTENQEYYPNRLFVTLPFYLQGLYIPDPANNGKRDSDIFYQGLEDSLYRVAFPDTGLESFSDEAADWIKKGKAAGLTNIAIAYPVKIANKNFVLAASWNKKLDFFDYDRNETYLDPHLGYTEYDMPQMVNGTDSVQVNWYIFDRYRSGSLQEYRGALAVDLFKNLKLGIGFTYLYGKTSDNQILDKVGWFRLFDINRYSFSYDTLKMTTSGTSKFSGYKADLGLLLKLERLNLGLNLKMPYTIIKKSDYDIAIADTDSENVITQKSTDKLKVPFCYTVGVSLYPTDKFMISLDYDLNLYSQAKWEIASNDTIHQEWVDQKIIKFGLQYSPFKFLDVRAGYSLIPQVWVPDGSAGRNRGPEAKALTIGAGFKLDNYGTIDIAWEHRSLKYFDQYFSNTNYCKDITNNVLISYRYEF